MNPTFRRNRGRRAGPALLGLAGAMLLVAGCAAPEASTEKSTPQAAVTQDTPAQPSDAVPAQPSDAVPATGSGDAVATTAAPATGGADTAAPGVRRVGARKPTRFDPEEFVGYQPDSLLPILGAPDFVRRDGPAQIWQYRAENCVFDLFLYGDGDTSRVTHVELRERRATNETAEACYSRMRAKRRPKPAG